MIGRVILTKVFLLGHSHRTSGSHPGHIRLTLPHRLLALPPHNYVTIIISNCYVIFTYTHLSDDLHMYVNQVEQEKVHELISHNI